MAITAITVIVSITAILIALIVGHTIIGIEQAKQDAIYKTAELAITDKARKAEVYSMNSSKYYDRDPGDMKSDNKIRIYDTGFERGFEACKRAVLEEIL